jgi:hypothetical protein
MSLYIKQCFICNNDFETKRSHTLFCSIKCKKKEEYNRKRNRYEVICEYCKKLFKTSNQQTRLCSPACINTITKKHDDIKKKCIECDNDFYTSYIRRRKQFCSYSCATTHKNKNRTEETNIKISETIKNQFASGERIHPFMGKILTEQHKQRISEERIIKGSAAGKHNPMFGKNHSIKTKEQISETRSNRMVNGDYKTWFCKGTYYSLKINKNINYKSSWEKQVIQFLDKDEKVISFSYEPIRVPYLFEIKRHYIPDLLITYKDGNQKLIEIKPSYYVDAEINQAKFKAAQEYCDSKGILFEVWTEKTINNLFTEESTNDLQI